MSTNEGGLDRALRIIIGLGLIGAALGFYGPAYTTVWGWIGIIPVVTGLIGWCPAYSAIGVNTCSRKAP
jgi:hypothetical protein